MRALLLAVLALPLVLPAVGADLPGEAAVACVDASKVPKRIVTCVQGTIEDCTIYGASYCSYPWFCLQEPYVYDPTCIITYW